MQPECLVSGRVFNHQGDFTVMGDNRVPEYVIDEPWQTPASVYHETWGYRSWQKRDDLPGKTAEHILNLVKVVSRGGNYLLNVGPTAAGEIPLESVARLREMGAWMRANGESIYATSVSTYGQPAWGRYTVKAGKTYAHVFDWPRDSVVALTGITTKPSAAHLLADGKPLVVEQAGTGFVVRVPAVSPSSIASVIVLTTGTP